MSTNNPRSPNSSSDSGSKETAHSDPLLGRQDMHGTGNGAPPSTAASRQSSQNPEPPANPNRRNNPNSTAELNALEKELGTSLFNRLDEQKIHDSLGWAGFLDNYRTLSNLMLYRREIIRVDDPGLHLMWITSPPTHYIKPLPSALVNESVIREIVNRTDSKTVWKSRGLLYSYTRLIHSELDFQLAIEYKLLPRSIATAEDPWKMWTDLMGIFREGQNYRKYVRTHNDQEEEDMKQYVEDQLEGISWEIVKQQEYNEISKCHRRYKYGNLRLERVNWISWLRGFGYNFWATKSPRDGLLGRHKKLIAGYIIYTGLVLTAMQVSLQASAKPVWVLQTFRYFGYVVILFTGGQVPLIISIFVIWLASQLVQFHFLTKKGAKAFKEEAGGTQTETSAAGPENV